MKKMNPKNFSLLSEDELKNVAGGQESRSSCPSYGICTGSCSDMYGRSGTCKLGPAPTYDCQCEANWG